MSFSSKEWVIDLIKKGFKNKKTLDKLSTSNDGTLLFDGEEIKGGGGQSDVSVSDVAPIDGELLWIDTSEEESNVISAKVEQTSTGATIKVADSDGTVTTADITNGVNGTNGVTPTIKAESGSNIGVVGTPSVTASTSGTTTTFTFNNLKGAKGDAGADGDKNVYSTAETVIGTYNGNVLYRRIFVLPNSGFYTFPNNAASKLVTDLPIKIQNVVRSGLLSAYNDDMSFNGTYAYHNPDMAIAAYAVKNQSDPTNKIDILYQSIGYNSTLLSQIVLYIEYTKS